MEYWSIVGTSIEVLAFWNSLRAKRFWRNMVQLSNLNYLGSLGLDGNNSLDKLKVWIIENMNITKWHNWDQRQSSHAQEIWPESQSSPCPSTQAPVEGQGDDWHFRLWEIKIIEGRMIEGWNNWGCINCIVQCNIHAILSLWLLLGTLSSYWTGTTAATVVCSLTQSQGHKIWEPDLCFLLDEPDEFHSEFPEELEFGCSHVLCESYLYESVFSLSLSDRLFLRPCLISLGLTGISSSESKYEKTSPLFVRCTAIPGRKKNYVSTGFVKVCNNIASSIQKISQEKIWKIL